MWAILTINFHSNRNEVFVFRSWLVPDDGNKSKGQVVPVQAVKAIGGGGLQLPYRSNTHSEPRH
jgi:hypothetical protein